MNTSQTYLITGASSGLGLAVAKNLALKRQKVIAVARGEEKLIQLKSSHSDFVSIHVGDVTDDNFLMNLTASLPEKIHGVFINAGGPPAGRFEDLSISEWDDAYQLVIRWKIQLVKHLLPVFLKQNYGRFLFSESTSVTRPVSNLVLSNSLRMAIVGLVRTLVTEYKSTGITFNVLAPGFHETKAIERLYKKLSEQKNISLTEAKKQLDESIPVGHTGDPQDYAELASWLLSDAASFVTGQVFNIDGGVSV
ncbi:SDR family oxidoreductase [Natronoflexus pectinivorans]|uniref:3-oxoacyl-[acyl-carrier protein] reductase n=1 Tax=Natronoflexus pectinivorans TaxID=682526 RepID=A0A4R2GDP6_9BACT|nr:SDR family oxidoreductase [Natronoflexus pectinivorans]TCO06020.1 3-oxoacyl-[acyl-carrier protein] reductase [Natronoflexus pectinivorans]